MAALNNVYTGARQGSSDTDVRVNDRPLDPRFDIVNHSPTGFNWGYCGSGPAQLALAILANEYGSGFAQYHYQAFKFSVIALLNRDRWTITSDQIRASEKYWLKQAVMI